MTLIEVTQADIDRSFDLWNAEPFPKVMDCCPVALAATRAFGTPMRVHKRSADSLLFLHWKRRGFDSSGDVLLPMNVQIRVANYDMDLRMDPFSFEVED